MTVAAEVVRYVTLIAASGSLALTALVVSLYARRYVRDSRVARSQGKRLRWRGLLPTHVILISTAHLLLGVTATLNVIDHLDDPLRWQAVTTCVALVISAGALFLLLRWQRRIYPRHDDLPPTPPLHRGAP